MERYSVADIEAMNEIAKKEGDLRAKQFSHKANESFSRRDAQKDILAMQGEFGGDPGACPRCAPDPCICDRTPSGPGTESLLPPEAQSQGNLFETETWKEYQAMQGRPATLKRKRRKDNMPTAEATKAITKKAPAKKRATKKKRAGGLPSAPPPIEEWVPEPVAQLQEETVMETPMNTPSGPTSQDAFPAQKRYEDDQEVIEEDIDPLEYLQANFEGAPSQGNIDLWRNRFGDVYITGLTDDEVYVWRTVKRLEYKNIMQRVSAAQQVMAKNQATAGNADEGRNSMFIEEICKTCILWPDIDQHQLTFSKAGTLDALANLILEASNFVPHQLAIRLTRKL